MNQREIARLKKLTGFDAAYEQSHPVFGMDEAGRGALVGPVVAACVCMDHTTPIEGVNDSKKISEKRRERIGAVIREQALSYGIGVADVLEIERYNILNATKLAMKRAFLAMQTTHCFLLIDALDPGFLGVKGEGVIQGDAKSYAIAAASILAKTHRDGLLRALAKEYPGYGFAVHKGYGTKAHIRAIREMGPCPLHRMSFLSRIIHEES